ncbi:UAA transporter family [Nesidiocoris tenuis]|uniref:UAA transporter family n=1 Tax=Nesidiocoris tenuis TaxID=355587 RepID=A0ABN7AAD0_9HEMI|nr:UAA transporter family [Nesidiocoris tenuis]
MGELFGACNVLTGCMLNAAFLELLVKGDPGCGTLVTFAQFFCIAVVGFVFTMKFGTVRRYIPIKNYFTVVVLFFVANTCNNYAFYFNISMPLHMTFRSGSLITNMLMSVVMLKRKYSFSKYASVILISAGVLLCTLVTGQEVKSSAEAAGVEDSFFWWLLGIFVLVFALLLSSLLGIYQETLFRTYGKHPYEALFYTHALPLPVFLLFSSNIIDHLNIAMGSEPLNIMGFAKVPALLVYLFGNVATQYLCISSVYYLTTESSTLTVTLVLTLRKFLSLIISVWLFQNDFSLYHWLGTGMVFFGTVIFTELHKQIGIVASDDKKSDKKKK